MCDILELQAALLHTANNYADGSFDREVLVRPTIAIFDLIKPAECSLWSINYNKTFNKAGDEKIERSASLLCRAVKPKYYNCIEETDFAHDLQKGLFCEVTKGIIDGNNRVTVNPGYFFRCNQDDVKNFGFRSLKFVQDRDLKDFIVIPITDYEGKIVAVLEFSFGEEQKIDDEKWAEIAPILCKFYAAAFKKYLIYLEQDLVEKLIQAHDEFKDKSIESYFTNLIKRVFNRYFGYQGASVFIWDSYHNRYRLIAITEKKEGVDTNEVFYYEGEGHTGKVGASGKACIIDKNLSDEKIKCCEKTVDVLKTAMIVPIASLSSPQKVIGIIRFINKKNIFNERHVDFFNDVNLKLVESASKYLSLAVYFFLKEEEQSSIISRLAHEFKTPANAIYKSAEMLLDYRKNKSFLDRYLSPYLKNISDFARLQINQAEATLYLTGHYKRKYTNKRCSLFEVLKKSRDIARPIAREYGVPFSNITIMPFNSHICLNIDEYSFVTIFNNLLTNAIKYHDSQNPDGFYVNFSCHECAGTIKIIIEDNGIGIDDEEKNDIFLVGYKGKSAIKEDATGFGIGLSTVKQIVEDYGGKVCVTNCKKPTRFEISLPISLKI